jgi:hypothetical protein
MYFLRTATIAATALVSIPCAAQSAPDAPRSVQLSKVVMDTTGGIKGKIKGGTACVFPSKWKIDGEKKTQDYERYDRLFSEKMKANGYTAITTSADMFGGEADAKGDFLIAATIRPDTINLCSSVKGAKGNALVNIDWQIYDRIQRKVILTASTQGAGAQEKFSNNGVDAMLDQAFQASLDALIAQSDTQGYLGVPVATAAVEVPTPAMPVAAGN